MLLPRNDTDCLSNMLLISFSNLIWLTQYTVQDTVVGYKSSKITSFNFLLVSGLTGSIFYSSVTLLVQLPKIL